MFERLSRSWSLIKASAGVLAKDKELLVFPLLSAVCTLVVGAAFVLPAIGMGALDGLREGGTPPLAYVLAFLFYLAQYFVIFFFNSALVGAAMIRLDGGDPTLADGLRIARGKAVPILGYAAIAATVGRTFRPAATPSGAMGPAFEVTATNASGDNVPALMLPFANLGRWYRTDSEKRAAPPQGLASSHQQRRRLTAHAIPYAVWLRPTVV